MSFTERVFQTGADSKFDRHVAVPIGLLVTAGLTFTFLAVGWLIFSFVVSIVYFTDPWGLLFSVFWTPHIAAWGLTVASALMAGYGAVIARTTLVDIAGVALYFLAFAFAIAGCVFSWLYTWRCTADSGNMDAVQAAVCGEQGWVTIVWWWINVTVGIFIVPILGVASHGASIISLQRRRTVLPQVDYVNARMDETNEPTFIVRAKIQ